MADKDDDDVVVDSRDHPALVRRLEKLSAERATMARELEAARAKIAEHEQAAKEHGKVAKEHERVLQEHALLVNEKASWADERTILAAGVTDAEGVDFVRLAWGRIGDNDRPKGGLGDWLKDRDKLPRGVQAYMPAAQGATEKGKAQGGKPPPDPNAGARTQTASIGAGAFDSERLAGLSDRDYASHREAIWSELGFAPPALPSGSQKGTA